MGEVADRRALKKAQTRAHVRTVAQEMFDEHGFDAVTIADIARRADVAVQTVFNHFPTKEELFFDGRTPWVTGAAEAVRDRDPAVQPLDALRAYLVDQVRELVGDMGCGRRQAYVRTLEASDTLPGRERELVFESERRLGDALREAWTSASPAAGPVPPDPGTAATLTAATWLSAVRALVVGHRTSAAHVADARTVAEDLGELTDRLLSRLAASTSAVAPA